MATPGDLPMDESTIHRGVMVLMWVSGVFSFVTLVWFQNAPYGRYTQASGWGPQLNAKLAWMVMETPNLWVTLICLGFARAVCLASLPNMVLLGMFCFHYVNRSLIYPLRMRGGKPMPFMVMFFAWLFCTCNGYLQARFLTHFEVYPEGWLTDPRFLVGASIFALGWWLNTDADARLRNLRRPGETGYKIPHGGLFELVSAANFAGEIFEWAGFAIAAWSLPALTFAAFTFMNTAPRGAQHHQWYLNKFKGEYPTKRKAVIPFIW